MHGSVSSQASIQDSILLVDDGLSPFIGGARCQFNHQSAALNLQAQNYS